MNENQRKLRLTAAREFMQSLEQLEVMLKSDTSSSESQVNASQTITSTDPPLSEPKETSLDALAADDALDQGAADIDRYIEDMEANKSATTSSATTSSEAN